MNKIKVKWVQFRHLIQEICIKKQPRVKNYFAVSSINLSLFKLIKLNKIASIIRCSFRCKSLIYSDFSGSNNII